MCWSCGEDQVPALRELTATESQNIKVGSDLRGAVQIGTRGGDGKHLRKEKGTHTSAHIQKEHKTYKSAVQRRPLTTAAEPLVQ